MTGRTKRLTIAVVLTTADVAVGDYYCGVIWQAYSGYPFATATLLGLLCLWVVSAVVIWLHVAYDLRQALRERGGKLAFNAAVTPAEPGRDSNV